METETEVFCLEIDLPIKKLPILVAYQVSIQLPAQKDGYASIVMWDKHQEGALFHNLLGKPLEQPISARNLWGTTRAYLTEHLIVDVLGSHLLNVIATKPPVGARLTLRCRGRYRLDELSIREVPPEEVPDVSMYTTALDRIPPAKRVGTVLLPELKAKDPTKPVSVNFFPAAAHERGEAHP